MPMPMPMKANSLPDGLQHVPADAVGFVHVRVGDLLASPVGKDLLKDIVGKDGAGLKKVESEVGMELASIETVTVVMLPVPTGRDLMQGRPDPVRWFSTQKAPPRNDFIRKEAVKDAFKGKSDKDNFKEVPFKAKEDEFKDERKERPKKVSDERLGMGP